MMVRYEVIIRLDLITAQFTQSMATICFVLYDILSRFLMDLQWNTEYHRLGLRLFLLIYVVW